MKPANLQKAYRGIVAGVVILAVLAGLGGSVAIADPQTNILAFREIDATQEGVVSANVTWTGNPAAMESAEVRVNGRPVRAQISPRGNNVQQSIAFLVDTSQAAVDSGTLNASKAWLTAWLKTLTGTQQQNQPIAIYAAGASPILMQDYTTDPQRLSAAVDRLGKGVGSTADDPSNRRSALWQTTKQAADRLNSYQIGQRNIVVISAAGNTVADGTIVAAGGSVKTSGAAYFAVVGPNATVSGKMEELSTVTGGFATSVLETSDLSSALDRVDAAVTDSQYRILINEDVSDSSVALTLTVGAQEARGTVPAGASATGTPELAVPVTEASPSGFLSSKVFLGAGLALVALAMGVIVYLVANNVFNTYSFSDQIASYNRFRESYITGEPEEEIEQSRFGATKSLIVQKALEAAERVAEERGMLNRVETALERANLTIKPAEFIVLYVSGVIALPLVGLYLGGFIIFLIFGLVGAVAPLALLSNLAERRRRKFLSQLPDALHLLAGSLRAGYSLMQGIEAVSEETPEPIAQELRRVITETRLGSDLIEALDKVSLRMNSQDFAWVVMGISIQNEVGGDLAELLDTVGETMIQRERLRRDIQALTAEGRISALVLILLPVALLVILNFMNPDYGGILISTTLGKLMLLVGAISLAIGWVWMKKIVSIKI
jgi:tight adherence protein B